MLNIVALIGRLTYEPELKVTSSGVSVINFQLAIDRQYQKQGEEKRADFVDCVAFRSTADFISRYFHKGSMIAIQGTLQTDSFTDKSGNKRKTFVVNCDNVSFCGKSEDANNSFSQKAKEQQEDKPNIEFEEVIEDDDLPF